MEFFAISNGIPVHISDSKKGDVCILFLHGYLQTLSVWEEFQGLISNCFKDLGLLCPRFVSMDLPGHGLSGTHPVSNSMEFCADVVKGVLDLCKVSSCVIVGHSLGGFIAQMCVNKYPEFFSYAFFFNTLTTPDSADVISKREKEIAFIRRGKFMELVSLVVPNMFYKDNLIKVDNHIQEILADCETHDINGIIASIQGMVERQDMTDYIKESEVPFIFFFSDKDVYFNISSYLGMKSLLEIPNESYHFQLVENCGHSIFLENPDLVSSFLSDIIIRLVCKLDTEELQENLLSTKGNC